MNKVEIKNKQGQLIIVEEGKHYYVEPDVVRYGSGIIYVEKIIHSSNQIIFDAITASLPDTTRITAEGRYICDVGSIYAMWIMHEEQICPPTQIDLTFEDLMKGEVAYERMG